MTIYMIVIGVGNVSVIYSWWQVQCEPIDTRVSNAMLSGGMVGQLHVLIHGWELKCGINCWRWKLMIPSSFISPYFVRMVWPQSLHRSRIQAMPEPIPPMDYFDRFMTSPPKLVGWCSVSILFLSKIAIRGSIFNQRNMFSSKSGWITHKHKYSNYNIYNNTYNSIGWHMGFNDYYWKINGFKQAYSCYIST